MFNYFRANPKAKYILLLISLLFLLTSDYLEIFYFYIFSDGLRFLKVFLLATSFLGIVGSLLGIFVTSKKVSEQLKKKLFGKNNPLLFLVLIIFGLAFFGNIKLTYALTENRKERILHNEPTTITTARVIGRNDHISRRSNVPYVVIEYSCNNKNYQQEIKSSYLMIGQEIHVRCSQACPQIFEVVHTPADDTARLQLLMKP